MKTAHKRPDWTYSKYRALLRYRGKPFAIVTPDGLNALKQDKVAVLLAALNRTRKTACPLSAKQRQLAKKHGTPAAFSQSVWAACPASISADEAAAAVLKYRREWLAAA